MADIYDFIVRRDFDSMSTDELRLLKSVSSDTYHGLLSSLKVMGECAFWACINEEYSNEQAKDDLFRISESLMCFNEQEAEFKIYQREGFPYTEVSND